MTNRERKCIEAILQAARGDEKGECWTLRRWLDERDVFNDDISGSERLIELACRELLGAEKAGGRPRAD